MAEVSWSELHTETDLFSWFGLVETGCRRDGDRTWIAVAPQALADAVRLRFALNGDEQVLAFQLGCCS